MKKIGILNCTHIKNYGSVLQSYAMELIVRKLTGYETLSVRYVEKKDIQYIRNRIPLLLDRDIVRYKAKGVKRKLYLKYWNKDLAVQCKKREEHFEEFVKSNFHFTDIYYNRNELINSTRDFSGYVLGSDQVWHPINYGSHFYTMEWIPDDVPKIVYGASFGVYRLPRNQLQGTRDFLSRIDAISVREKRGADIVKELIDREAIVVADPTLLLTTQEWDLVKKDIKLEDKYIFCYFLGDNRKAREYAQKVARKYNLKIYAVVFMDEINKIDFNFGDEQLYDIGPAEFISYIEKAEYVITDSFHGTIFSILYNKEFIVFNRFEISKGQSTNSRIDSLLGIVGLENRRKIDIQDVETINADIDYEEVKKKIDRIQDVSIRYLKEKLSVV